MSTADCYKVYGPDPDPGGNATGTEAKWKTSRVDCWQCLRAQAVTQATRCYVPVRNQGKIDGSYATFQAIEDQLTRRFGYFCTWSCALGYAMIHFPNLAHKVHLHAKRNGFCGLLAPTLDPRAVMHRFHPHLTEKTSMAYSQLIPDPGLGKYMRYVPDNEQNTTRFPDVQHVVDEVVDEPEAAAEFPQAVVDSERLIDQLVCVEDMSSGDGAWANAAKKNTKKTPNLKKTTKKTKPPKPPGGDGGGGDTKRVKVATLQKTGSPPAPPLTHPRLQDYF